MFSLEVLLDGWRMKPRIAGQCTNIFDGAVCRTKLKNLNSKLFFSNLPHEKNGPDNELHIGVNLGLDWFSYIHSNIAPSHSSAPTSFSVYNLPPEYQYCTLNLMCMSILPGPKKQNPDQIQRFLHPIILDLLHLWKFGISVPTEPCPHIVIVCDKPAAHKVGGFASHSHTNFCTLCWITLSDKTTPTAFQEGAFRTRTNKEQSSARKNFVKDFATQYSQLSRLPYFNLVEQIVIDPMHNLFLCLMKMHFYNIWVQSKILRPNHELDAFHKMLADIPQLWTTCMPSDASDQILHQRVATIEKLKAEKTVEATCNADNRKALANAKKCRKDAYEAEKARIASLKLQEVEARNQEKLHATAAKHAEKARIAAEKKA
ncbi:hypothetical protein CY34DRAFT_110541 [Suillus luteus UH-Slu-Lm8-n1]|uniref:Uncharacterized protein n=1 Tax=Suillus luteus UH-Slu-Lm8-n1 TaxID=930992 RepID=A0A0C9ZWC6_9AGAM|nr:hypothetical protein CY34DRAFT_110541 [Suillus luteus UH-Slu-Lm8-n1]